MKLDFLVVNTTDPIAGAGGDASALALRLSKSGKRTGVFLVQNGVVPARRGARWDLREDLVGAGVTIQADGFSLRERGVGPDALADGIEETDLDPILDALADGTRILWN